MINILQCICRVVGTMDNMVVINNLNFKYNNKVIFDNFNLSIEKGSFTTIIGNNGSGKSTLVKLLTGLINSNSIFIDDVLLCNDNMSFIRERMGVVFDYSFNSFFCTTVYDELCMNSRLDIEFMCNELGINSLLYKNPNCLSNGERQLISIACVLVRCPDLIILDDAFTMMDSFSKVKVLKYLQGLSANGVTVINFTSDIEESLYGTDIILIDKGKVLLRDDKDSFYKQEKVLKSVGFGLPFMVDLSKRLSYYGLVDDFIYNMDEMVDLLWK